MPELPEVETVKKGLEEILVNKTIKNINLSGFSLRFPIPKNFASLASGKKILSIGRRAKYILFSLSDNISIISHLGMSGSYRILSYDESISYKPNKHDHIIFQFEDFKVVYNDPRRFGYIFITDKDPNDHKLIALLGPEPITNNFNEIELAKSFYKKERPIKNALLDQTIISGLGNIYVCEALFRSKINPKKRIKKLVYSDGSAKKPLITLKDKINEVIEESILLGGSSLKDLSNTEGKMGYFQNTFSVYGREGEFCILKDCDQKIKRITQAGRSTFYCPKCQK